MLFYTNNFQDAATKTIKKVFSFHLFMISLMCAVLMLVGLMLITLWGDPFYSIEYMEDDFIETVWTMMPFILMCGMALPSMYILSLIETPSKSKARSHTMKAIGHQWYWTYEYDFEGEFYVYDSYMVPYKSLVSGDFRLLEADNPLVIEKDKWYRMMATSEDVIHSFALPSLGLKLDSVPGRLNQQSLHPESVGVYYGQCSEMCGANHSFMPMVANVIN